MDLANYSMASLFDQLGLDSSDEGIKQFIDKNGPIPDKTQLHEASFWTSHQSAFLEQAIDTDAEWAPIVDELDASLR